MADTQLVTLAQLTELLALERQKLEGLLNSAGINWKKEGTKIQYNAWSDVLDHSDKVTKGKEIVDHQAKIESYTSILLF